LSLLLVIVDGGGVVLDFEQYQYIGAHSIDAIDSAMTSAVINPPAMNNIL
jgi:hypothetical protein